MPAQIDHNYPCKEIALIGLNELYDLLFCLRCPYHGLLKYKFSGILLNNPPTK